MNENDFEKRLKKSHDLALAQAKKDLTWAAFESKILGSSRFNLRIVSLAGVVASFLLFFVLIPETTQVEKKFLPSMEVQEYYSQLLDFSESEFDEEEFF